jgi:hypothetical protein
MRDDTRVKRFRMRPLWLKMFVYMQILLVAYAILTTFLVIRLLQANTRLAKTNAETESLLADATNQLQRLERVRGILANSDREEFQPLIDASEKSVAKAPQESDPAERKNISLSKLFQPVDLKEASVEDFQAQLQGRDLHLSFNLNNLLPGEESISGRAEIQLVTDDGSVVNLPTDANDMSYLIQRYKQVRTRAQLPAGVPPQGIFGLRLILESSNGEEILRELHPLAENRP